ncbi:MAG: transcriptional regulator of arginine metabolism [Chlamydiales bacterium]|jgi:transcriptional regulator of arginine metabolism
MVNNMQSDATSASARRKLLVELIGEGRGSSQQALVGALSEHGVEVTQATLSRDLRELGAVKGTAGYVVPEATTSPLAEAIGRWLVSATPARNLTVLRTPPGGASPLAVTLDAAGRADIIGTVAGDDTILVISPSDKAADSLAAELGRLVRGAS